ncbi:MAG: helix-turn-helix domain-containing protein [Neomegalonema sp.]|nr:helix-turn-helix domain-containing protein [Neomegalonema sp.]
MTQDQLSERTGLLTSVISELENGRARYNQTHIELLCAAFDVPVCELIEPGNAPECSAEAPTCRCSLSLRDESQLKSLIETAVRDAMSDGEWRLKKV